MSALETVQAARTKVDEANEVLRSTAKEAVKEGLDTVFADPSVTLVMFAQKSSEYDDEGMYPGVYGPDIREGEYNIDQILDDRWEELDGLLGYGSLPTDPRGVQLKAVLEAVGDDVLSDLFGDESVVFVTKGEKGYSITSEYAGV